MAAPFARTDRAPASPPDWATARSDSPSFVTCASPSEAAYSAGSTPQSARDALAVETRLLNYGAVYAQRRSEQRAAAQAEADRVAADDAAARDALAATRAALHARVLRDAAPPPARRPCTTPPSGASWAVPHISRRSAQLAAARRRRDGVDGLSVAQRLSQTAGRCNVRPDPTSPWGELPDAVALQCASGRQSTTPRSLLNSDPRPHISTRAAQLRRRPGHCAHDDLYDHAKARQQAREAAPSLTYTFQPVLNPHSVRLAHASAPPRPRVVPDDALVECTFAPSINRDSAVATLALPLATRMQLWHTRRERKLRAAQDARGEDERRECTFRPSILHADTAPGRIE